MYCTIFYSHSHSTSIQSTLYKLTMHNILGMNYCTTVDNDDGLKGSQHKDNVQQNKTTKGQNSVGIVLV